MFFERLLGKRSRCVLPSCLVPCRGISFLQTPQSLEENQQRLEDAKKLEDVLDEKRLLTERLNQVCFAIPPSPGKALTDTGVA